jgi:hypothetical protein
MERQLSFDLKLPSGLELEIAALREHVAAGGFAEYANEVLELRRAVQLCSVGRGEIPVCPRGVATRANLVVAGLELEPFVERRIRGWAGLN